jgi:hypothetical protein
LRIGQYVLLGALCIALLSALTLAILGGVDGMTWTLAPSGWLLLDGLLVVLGVAALPLLVRRANALVALGVAAAMCIAAGALIAAPPYAVNRLTGVVFALGAAALFVAWMLGPRGWSGARKRWALVVVPALAVAGLLLLAAPISTFPWETKQTSSPAARWVLAVSVRDWGSFDEFHSIVWVYRDAGLVRQRRIVYKINSEVPEAGWRDDSTVIVDARAIDIKRDATINAGTVLRQ